VQDTGPGFHAGPGSRIAGALEEATDQARQISTDASQGEITQAEGRLAETRQLERDDPRQMCHAWSAALSSGGPRCGLSAKSGFGGGQHQSFGRAVFADEKT
jgi:hypothetical protein